MLLSYAAKDVLLKKYNPGSTEITISIIRELQMIRSIFDENGLTLIQN